jgi:hypothetical protein
VIDSCHSVSTLERADTCTIMPCSGSRQFSNARWAPGNECLLHMVSQSLESGAGDFLGPPLALSCGCITQG